MENRQIPIYCVPCLDEVNREFMVCWVAVSLPPDLQSKVEKAMTVLRGTKDGNRWCVQTPPFPGALVKASGVTPSWYYDNAVDSVTVNDDAFLRDCFERSGLSDYTLFRVVWSAISQNLPRWLIREGRPVDLGILRLFAFPFRRNWTVNLLAKFPRLRSVFKHKDEVAAAALDGMGVSEDIRNTVNMAIDDAYGSTTFRWTVDVIPGESFYRYTRELELARHAAFPGSGYIQQWSALIKRSTGPIFEVLRHASQELSKPAGTLRKDDASGAQTLVPCVDVPGVRGQIPDRLDGPVVCDPELAAVAGDTGEVVASHPVGQVSPVSFVRLRAANMRVPGTDGRIRVRREKPAGVLVLPSVGGE